MALDKLYYFNLPGRAETTRLCYAIAGEDLDDFRFSMEDWHKFKSMSPTGKAPYMRTSDGMMLAESNAIALYCGAKHNMLPSDAKELAHVVEVMSYADTMVGVIYWKIFGTPQEQRPAAIQELKDTLVPAMATKLDQMVKRTQDAEGHIAGNKLTVADVSVFALVKNMQSRLEFDADLYPGLKGTFEAVNKNDKVQQYYTTKAEDYSK